MYGHLKVENRTYAIDYYEAENGFEFDFWEGVDASSMMGKTAEIIPAHGMFTKAIGVISQSILAASYKTAGLLAVAEI